MTKAISKQTNHFRLQLGMKKTGNLLRKIRTMWILKTMSLTLMLLMKLRVLSSDVSAPNLTAVEVIHKSSSLRRPP